MLRRKTGLGVVLLLGLALSGTAGAQSLYKCKDAAGKITYAGRECALMGLQSAGEIKDSMSSSPALPLPRTKSSGGVPPPASQPVAPPKAEEKAQDDPERRCFKTAKGFRCNDKPEEK